jgi:hypothetical protein
MKTERHTLVNRVFLTPLVRPDRLPLGND